MSRPRYPVTAIFDGEANCPHDEHFIHDWFFGCVPADFAERTGKSKTYVQTRVEGDRFPHGYRYLWNGGCDAHESTGAVG